MLNRQKHPNNIKETYQQDRVEIVFYADPLCCWSYAMLKQLDKLQNEFGSTILLRLRMGGLIKNWEQAFDPVNNVKNASQMGPVWMEASQTTGIDFKHQLWAVSPPVSSFPACIAVKTAGLQSAEMEMGFFREIAEMAMLEGKDSSRPENLVEAAERLQEQQSVFELHSFLENYNNEQSRDAFRQDLHAVTVNQIKRFPTVTMNFQGKGIVCTGYRTYEVLEDALMNIHPALCPQNR